MKRWSIGLRELVVRGRERGLERERKESRWARRAFLLEQGGLVTLFWEEGKGEQEKRKVRGRWHTKANREMEAYRLDYSS